MASHTNAHTLWLILCMSVVYEIIISVDCGCSVIVGLCKRYNSNSISLCCECGWQFVTRTDGTWSEFKYFKLSAYPNECEGFTS